MPLTKITKVGAFSDDVATQINNNFALLGTVLKAQGADLEAQAPPQPVLAQDLKLDYPPTATPEPPTTPTAAVQPKPEDDAKKKAEDDAKKKAEDDAKKKPEDKHADHKR